MRVQSRITDTDRQRQRKTEGRRQKDVITIGMMKRKKSNREWKTNLEQRSRKKKAKRFRKC